MDGREVENLKQETLEDQYVIVSFSYKISQCFCDYCGMNGLVRVFNCHES